MPPRNLLLAIALGAFSTLAHPFAFAGRLIGSRGSMRRAKVDTARWTPELLKRLEWRRFEQLCAAYFEAAGAGSASAVVHCKPWDAYRVGIKPVRELHGAMAAAGAAGGVLVTPGKFTQEAETFAAKENIQLIDGTGLLAKLSGLVPEQAAALLKLATQGDFLTPTCPSCGIKMAPRKSTQGGRKFWGCTNYPRCKQTFFATGT
jgi:restriction system protein